MVILNWPFCAWRTIEVFLWSWSSLKLSGALTWITHLLNFKTNACMWDISYLYAMHSTITKLMHLISLERVIAVNCFESSLLVNRNDFFWDWISIKMLSTLALKRSGQLKSYLSCWQQSFCKSCKGKRVMRGPKTVKLNVVAGELLVKL